MIGVLIFLEALIISFIRGTPSVTSSTGSKENKENLLIKSQ